VRPHIRGAAAYICPIRVGGGTRLKVLDALSMGIPLVGSAVGVEGLGLRDGEHYLEANEPEAVVAQVRRLEGDAALAERLAAAGRGFVVGRYAWTRVAALLDDVYQSVAHAPALQVR
jgi:glycosyltransferase involved in cell wall biosynthesis